MELGTVKLRRPSTWPWGIIAALLMDIPVLRWRVIPLWLLFPIGFVLGLTGMQIEDVVRRIWN